MSSRRAQRIQAAIRHRSKELRREIQQAGYVCSGTITVRTKVCGKPGCRCAKDPDARHGPYYEWTRRAEGRLRHSVVQPEEAELLAIGIENYRAIQGLLKQWEVITAEEVITPRKKKSK